MSSWAFTLWLISGISQNETSEEFIGEWVENRGIRDQLVIATKASPVSRVTLLQLNVQTLSLVHNQLQAGKG